MGGYWAYQLSQFAAGLIIELLLTEFKTSFFSAAYRTDRRRLNFVMKEVGSLVNHRICDLDRVTGIKRLC